MSTWMTDRLAYGCARDAACPGGSHGGRHAASHKPFAGTGADVRRRTFAIRTTFENITTRTGFRSCRRTA